MDDKTLRKYCSNEPQRKELHNPFNLGGFTYSTDGNILIEIPKNESYDIYKTSESIISGLQNFVLKTLEGSDKFEWIQPPKKSDFFGEDQCSNCKGSGKYELCPDCEGEGNVSWESENGYNYEASCKMCNSKGNIHGTNEICEKCDGQGICTNYKEVKFKSSIYVNGQLLNKIIDLPVLEFAVSHLKHCDPIPFKFYGGRGIIMPLRMPTGEKEIYDYAKERGL